MKTKLLTLCLILLGTGFLAAPQKKGKAVGGPGGGDSSPIEVAEGTVHVHGDGGFSINPVDSLSADGNETGFRAHAFMLKGCTSASCSVALDSNWQVTLTDKSNVDIDEFCQDSQNMASLLVHNITGEPFVLESGGKGIKHQHGPKFDHFTVTATSTASPSAGRACPGSMTPQTLTCSGTCKAVILYCKNGSPLPNSWSCK